MVFVLKPIPRRNAFRLETDSNDELVLARTDSKVEMVFALEPFRFGEAGACSFQVGCARACSYLICEAEARSIHLGPAEARSYRICRSEPRNFRSARLGPAAVKMSL